MTINLENKESEVSEIDNKSNSNSQINLHNESFESELFNHNRGFLIFILNIIIIKI